jgi:two-component system OmpR family sensor kinase
MLAMLPLAALLIWVAVGRALAPLQALVTEVSSRDADALQPLVLEDLPREIMPLAAALNALLARLAEALQAQQAFVADAAHELRTPLTALALQAQLAQRVNDEPQRRQAFEDLRAGLARASRLVQQLLTLAREENPQARVFSGTVDLVDVARQTVEALEPVAARSQARLELGLGSEPVWVRGDADALSILLKNLLENALLHGSPAAGAIEVNVAAGKPGQGPLLVVRDHGEGISSQEQPRVFDRFYRSPGTQGSGSGLGLAIVAHIAKRHHAQVSLEHAKPGLRCVIHFPDPAAQPQG